METKDKKKITQVLKEEPVVVRVGVLRCRIKPLTLCQIYEVGTLANDIKPLELKEGNKINVIQQMLEHGNDAKILTDIFIVCAFRKKIMRKIFSGYIRKRLKIEHVNELIKYLSISFNINFFLTSITFLKQIKKMTEPQMIHRGQSLGE